MYRSEYGGQKEIALCSLPSRTHAQMVKRCLNSNLRRSNRCRNSSLTSHRRRHISIDRRWGCRRGAIRATLGSCLRALPANVSRLAAPVARLARRVRRPSVRRRAVAANVAKLSACVALHGLSLAVAREVVRAAALVASCGTVRLNAGEASTKAAARWSACTTTCWGCGGGCGCSWRW